MTLPQFIGSLLTTALFANGPAAASQLLYLASIKDKNIVAYAVNAETGELKQRFQIDLPGNSGPLAFSPDASFVYAAMTGLDDNKAGVATLKRAENGSLTLISTAHITSRAPYIRVDKTGRFLLAAHYGAGDVTVYRISDGIFTGELVDQRATARTAHCIEIDPSGKFVFVPHTSPNKVFQFRLNLKTGKLVPNDPPAADGPDVDHKYHAPRHYAHHPKLNIAYTSNESGGGISAWAFDPKNGTLSRLQTLSTLPANYEGSSAAADIHLTPDGRFAYVSNRDVTKRAKGEPTRDSLAAVSLDPKTGKMKVIGTFPTAHLPRSFCIDLTGQFLYSAGQGSATLVAYRIDRETGALHQFATYETGGVPIWVMCGNVKQ
jgi:6-phosphogluconolactonase